MSIILTPSFSLPDTRQYFHTKQDFLCTKNPIQTGDVCVFDLFNCCLPIPQFIDLTDPTDPYKNDWFSFIFAVATNYTVEAEIENVSTGSILPLDNTLGALQPLGFYTDRPEVWSFRVDWNKVQGLLDFGEFKFRFTIKNSSGNVINESESPCFRLMQYDCDEAHGTVRIETTQTGYIVNGFDYRDIFTIVPTPTFPLVQPGWKQQIRWYGQLSPDTPDEEEDFMQDSKRIEFQIQQKLVEKFKFRLDFIRSTFGQNIIKDQFLADEILISDYNYNNYEVYRDKAVRKVSTDEIIWHRMQKGITVTWTMKETDEGNVKRIYG